MLIVPSMCIYYPPRDLFALKTGNPDQDVFFFAYTGAQVLCIISVDKPSVLSTISQKVCNLQVYIIYH